MEEKAGNVTQPLMLFPFRYDGIYMRGTNSKMPQLIAGFRLLVFGLISILCILAEVVLNFMDNFIVMIKLRNLLVQFSKIGYSTALEYSLFFSNNAAQLVYFIKDQSPYI